MVPHSLFVRSDRYVDLTLNLLTFIVGAGVLATLIALIIMGLRPLSTIADRGDVGPPAWASMSNVLLSPSRIDFDFQLPALPTMYRCEHRGQVSYSDRPCTAGGVRALPVRPL